MPLQLIRDFYHAIFPRRRAFSEACALGLSIMRPTLAQLEAFYWIGRLGGFHAAARHLHLTQPTISARVSELETTLGVQLFDRKGRSVTLTPRAREILPAVERMLKISDEISQRRNDSTTLRGLLRLGAVESVALFTLPILLPRLRASYPDLKIELTLDIGSVLNRKINTRDLDVAILTDARIGESVTVERVGEIEYSWVASNDFALPDRELVPTDLRRVPIFTNPNPSTIYAVMTDWFRSGNVEPEQVTMCNSLALMSRLVIAGSGLAILQPQILQAELQSGLIRTVPSNPVVRSRTMVVAYHDPSRSYRPLIDMICSALHQSGLLARTPAETRSNLRVKPAH
jgi:DNA-binding transcriptional LysR family regulator